MRPMWSYKNNLRAQRGSERAQRHLLNKLNYGEGGKEVFRIVQQIKGEKSDIILKVHTVRNNKGRVAVGSDSIKKALQLALNMFNFTGVGRFKVSRTSSRSLAKINFETV